MMLPRTIALAVTIGLTAAASCFGAQYQDPDLSKGLESNAYAKKRQKTFTSPSPGRGARKPAPKRYYRPAKSQTVARTPRPKTVPRGTELADIGFTLWKFGKIEDADDPKILKEVHPKTQESIAARRIESESMLSVGDVVRLGIESGSHPGHLYVINREKYADGTFGKPTLIFPTLAAGRGRNFVQPGLLMYFPSPQDYFEVKSDTAAKQHAEELIVIVSPTEIVDPGRLRLGMLELGEAEVDGWIKKWGVDAAKMELENGAGEPMTEAEKAAGDQQKSFSLVPSLKAEDAVPQTLYRMRIKRGDPVLARIELKINPK